MKKGLKLNFIWIQTKGRGINHELDLLSDMLNETGFEVMNLRGRPSRHAALSWGAPCRSTKSKSCNLRTSQPLVPSTDSDAESIRSDYFHIRIKKRNRIRIGWRQKIKNLRWREQRSATTEETDPEFVRESNTAGYGQLKKKKNRRFLLRPIHAQTWYNVPSHI